MADLKVVARNQITKENQVLRQILGICSSLAVTNLMMNSLVMGLGVAFVTGLSSFTISLLNKLIPQRIRMLIQTFVIAFYVILVNLFLQAYMPDISKQLGPYVGLIITNCIIMGRAEAFAAQNPPLPALVDGFFSGIGYLLVLLVISFIREFLGFGTLFGIDLGLNFTRWTLMVMPPAAFFVIAILIWFTSARTIKAEQKERSS
ncbi:MAG: NADH:ubiquinone reductase (Na(+)-transporting) subunit D [Tissierellia bacterium]|nr:NADH:ubiquinone reductase (Na(+)-transporting) subunit D [Tissierellia bacterium]